MTHILLISALPRSLINFRGDLLKALVATGHKVIKYILSADTADLHL